MVLVGNSVVPAFLFTAEMCLQSGLTLHVLPAERPGDETPLVCQS